MDHFVDSNDAASVSEHESSSDSESELIQRPRGTVGSSQRETHNAGDRTSIPHSRTTTFKDAELQRDVSGSFGGEMVDRLIRPEV